MSQPQRQVQLSEIYAIIGQKEVEKQLAAATYEAALATSQQRVRELEKQVAEMTEQLAQAKVEKKAAKSKE